MTKYLLLEVEDIFQLSIGLIIAPDFPARLVKTSLPSLSIEVITPAGGRAQCAGSLNFWSFNIPGADSDRRMRLVLALQGVGKSDIPPGSRLLTDDDKLAQALGLIPIDE